MTPGNAISRLLAVATGQLAAELAHPYQEAFLLLSVALGKTKAQLLAISDQQITDQQAAKFLELVGQRAAGKPFAYLVGEKDFWKSSFLVSPATLIPRPETELLVETMLKAGEAKKNLQLLELGTGCGCIILSLLLEQPSWLGTALDISSEAIAIARKNASLLGVSQRVNFFTDNWQEKRKSLPQVGYDVVVTNPPYLTGSDIAALSREVKDQEPLVALDGGVAGLELIASAINYGALVLKDGGLIALEHGLGQGKKVIELLRKNGFDKEKQHYDLAGCDRVVIAARKVD